MGKPVILVELTAQVWAQLLRSGTPNVNGSNYRSNTRVAIDTSAAYTVKCIARRVDSSANGTLKMGVVFYDSSFAVVAFNEYAANGVTPSAATFTTYSGTFGFGTGNPFPGSAVYMGVGMILNLGGTLGAMDMRQAWIEKNSAPGVSVTADQQMRDPNEWALISGTAGSFITEQGISGAGTLVDKLTLRYSTAAYTTPGWDTPPRAQYDARVLQPGTLSTALPANFGGSIITSYGEMVLNNADGALGPLAYYGLDGQPFKVLMGMDDGSYSTFTTVLAGTMQQVTVDRKTARIRLAGKDTLFDNPVCRSRYLGNNVLPNGLEGTSADLAGQPKPQLYGVAINVAPPCVNTSRLIYHVANGGCSSIYNVRDAGVLLTAGAAYTSQADMETNAPAAGQVRMWPAGGYFRLGSAPAGLVTACAIGNEAGYLYGATFYNVLYSLAFDAGIDTTNDLVPGHGAGYLGPAPINFQGNWATDQPALGIWVMDTTTTFRQAMDQVAQSVCAWYGYTGVGVSGTGLKYGAAVFQQDPQIGLTTWPSYDLSVIKSITAVADPGSTRGVPIYEVELGYAYNYTVFSPALAPSIPPQQLYDLALRTKRAWWSDGTIQFKHVTARKLAIETHLADDATKAAAEAQRRQSLTRWPRPWYQVELALQGVRDLSATQGTPGLGGFVNLTWPELQVIWLDGVTRTTGLFCVMGIQVDFLRNSMTLTVRQAVELGW